MQVYAISDIGKTRKVNQDSFYYDPNKKGLFIVADGMGGHLAGEVASELAVATLAEELLPCLSTPIGSRKEVELKILKAIEISNRTVYEKARKDESFSGMGTTVVLCLVLKDEAHIAHIGDSRCYLIRGGQITQLTVDHSLVQELLKKGKITEEEAENHPRKNILTRALGTDLHVEPDYMRFNIKEGDILVLSTDGVTNQILPNELLAFSSENDPKEACEKMIRLANDRGGYDNLTVLVINNISQLEGK